MSNLRRIHRCHHDREEELFQCFNDSANCSHVSWRQAFLQRWHHPWRRILPRIAPTTAKRRGVERVLFFVLMGLYFTYNIVFYIRYFTMSRPKWIYGSPMDARDVAKCIQSAVESTADGFRYDWFLQEQNATKHTASQRLLVAQYSGYGTYAKLLDVVAPVNVKYAQDWGHDFVVLQGTAMTFNSINPSCPDEHRSTFNKIPLLQLAYEKRDQYDQVLILDTDAMIVDFHYDMTRLLPSTHLLAAHRVWPYDWRNTWDINAGITLWNLHHFNLPRVLEDWAASVQAHPSLVLERNDDQYFLQASLLRLGFWQRWVYSLTHEFHYYDATVIKHFKRDARSWSTTSLEQRLLRIKETIQGLAATHQVAGNIVSEFGIKFSERIKEGNREEATDSAVDR